MISLFYTYLGVRQKTVVLFFALCLKLNSSRFQKKKGHLSCPTETFEVLHLAHHGQKYITKTSEIKTGKWKVVLFSEFENISELKNQDINNEENCSKGPHFKEINV